MCGIFGYIGKRDARRIIVEGLKRLEYRGYDSWGIALLEKGEIHQYRDISEISINKRILELPCSNIGIGHTRWATHGGVSRKNAHPHISLTKDFTLVQNGIVENYEDLKKDLMAKHVTIKSETDTEIIVRLIEEQRKKIKDLKKSIISVFKKLKGRNTIAVLDSKNEKIYAIRNGSPLILGIGEKEIFLASDTLSFSPYCKNIVVVDNFEMVEIDRNSFKVTDLNSSKVKNLTVTKLRYLYEDIDKGEYEHYMLKEIVEQSNTFINAIAYSEKDLQSLSKSIKQSSRVYIIGAGTAGFAAGQIAYFLRKVGGIDAQDLRSYEFASYLPIIKPTDLIIALSQSGETADTIEALEELKKRGCKIGSLVNMLGTTISRLSDFQFFSNAGPEICVASTKVFTSQCVWGYILAKNIASDLKRGKREILTLAKELKAFFSSKNLNSIDEISKKLVKQEHMFILGKGQNFNIALEGSLKIKEISYKHVEGFAAGELKHGVIALIEKGTVVFGIVSNDRDSKDILSAMEQVKARGAFTIGIGDKKFKEKDVFDRYIETPGEGISSSITNVIPFQLISYYLSVRLGNNIDKPRNLAKSVTVK